jgi:hypothetical protein
MSNADVVNTWFRERLSSGPLARDTAAYNQVNGARLDLIARLDAAAAATSAGTQAAPGVAAAPAPAEATKIAEEPKHEVSAAPGPAAPPNAEPHGAA